MKVFVILHSDSETTGAATVVATATVIEIVTVMAMALAVKGPRVVAVHT